MKNVMTPRTVSFEDALRNLAAKLTGAHINELPRTQEGVVQYMAERVLSMDEMAEAITREVMARMVRMASADGEPSAADQSTSEQAQAAPTEEIQAKSRKSK